MRRCEASRPLRLEHSFNTLNQAYESLPLSRQKQEAELAVLAQIFRQVRQNLVTIIALLSPLRYVQNTITLNDS